MCMYTYVQWYTMGGKKHNKRKQPAIPRFLPRFNITGPDDPRYEEFCHIKLMMYKPAHESNPLNPNNLSWSELMREYLSNEDNNIPEKVKRVLVGDPLPQSDEEESSELESSEEEEADPALQPEFVLAGYPHQVPADPAYEPPSDPHAYWHSLPAEITNDAHR